MVLEWYRRWIGRYVFRKLNTGVALCLFIVFIAIGYITYSRFYDMLETRERDLLELRTDHLSRQLDAFITQFKRESISFYPIGREASTSYQYFLPDSVPQDENASITERNAFSNLQSYLLERNPQAMTVILYRSADRRLFEKTRYPSAQRSAAFDFPAFFDGLPRDYSFPYIGATNRFFQNLERPVLYFVNPIFDFRTIHPSRPQGYFVMGIDSRSLFELFRGGDKRGLELEILRDGVPLMQNRSNVSGSDASFIRSISALPQYGLEVVGGFDKRSIQAEVRKLAYVIFAGMLIAWLVCVFLIHYILRFVIRRLKDLVQHFKKVQTNPFAEPMVRAGEDEIGDLIERFNRMTGELQQYINRVYVAEVQKSNAEYFALKMQINPHFLYNTLESLRMQAVVRKQPDLANKLFSLGRLYRWILKTDADEIPVEEELQYTRYYLELLMMGKSKQIELEANSPFDLRDCYMPKFSLQPIIENALLHGELEKSEQPRIRLAIRDEGPYRCIEISDNGKGAAPEAKAMVNEGLQAKTVFRDNHLGLKNIHERIRAYYGEPYGLSVNVSGEGEGFSLVMRLPRPQEENEDAQTAHR
ncbi:histidine kinase [Paenibacillus sp.]|uniref:sensor histidine kinase n=1 Tax=Paenibacillus sp. TaxID=58172 RepID=UPI00281289D1|nr:histidine kinase [Paenibacillus sp.]